MTTPAPWSKWSPRRFSRCQLLFIGLTAGVFVCLVFLFGFSRDIDWSPHSIPLPVRAPIQTLYVVSDWRPLSVSSVDCLL